MTVVTNISITPAAEAVLTSQLRELALANGALPVLVFIQFYNEPDGSRVPGFVPGYQLAAWPAKYLTPDWLPVRLSKAQQLHLLPRLEWSKDRRYLVDNISGPFALFSLSVV